MAAVPLIGCWSCCSAAGGAAPGASVACASVLELLHCCRCFRNCRCAVPALLPVLPALLPVLHYCRCCCAAVSAEPEPPLFCATCWQSALPSKSPAGCFRCLAKVVLVTAAAAAAAAAAKLASVGTAVVERCVPAPVGKVVRVVVKVALAPIGNMERCGPA